MSSALAMVLTAAMAVPGNGPEMVSGEMEQGLDLCGRWEGELHDSSGVIWTVILEDRVIERKTQDCCIREGCLVRQGDYPGTCHFDGWPGLFKQEDTRVIICVRKKNLDEWPTSFRAGDRQELFILHRVKLRK